eukprot:733000-Rhodomonas_salina.1
MTHKTPRMSPVPCDRHASSTRRRTVDTAWNADVVTWDACWVSGRVGGGGCGARRACACAPA